jgi:nitrogen fixation protein NifU and related proteins
VRSERSGAELEALFQETILAHYRRPRNKGALDDATSRALIRNPACGDQIEVQVALDGDGRVREARFTGQGCSIMQASASMMTDAVRGLTHDGVDALAGTVAAMLEGDARPAADERLGDLRALSGVARFPARRQCAALPWRALATALDHEGTGR